MIIESFKKEEDKKEKNILANYTLFILAVATSIDALIIGLGISIFKVPDCIFSADNRIFCLFILSNRIFYRT